VQLSEWMDGWNWLEQLKETRTFWNRIPTKEEERKKERKRENQELVDENERENGKRRRSRGPIAAGRLSNHLPPPPPPPPPPCSHHSFHSSLPSIRFQPWIDISFLLSTEMNNSLHSNWQSRPDFPFIFPSFPIIHDSYYNYDYYVGVGGGEGRRKWPSIQINYEMICYWVIRLWRVISACGYLFGSLLISSCSLNYR